MVVEMKKKMERHERRKFFKDLAWFIIEYSKPKTEAVIEFAKKVLKDFDEEQFRPHLEEIREKK